MPDPDRLDLSRTNVRSAAFGGGAHHCLGAAVARLAAREAPGLMLEWYGALGPIVDGPRWREEHVVLRSLRSLTVRAAGRARCYPANGAASSV